MKFKSDTMHFICTFIDKFSNKSSFIPSGTVTGGYCGKYGALSLTSMTEILSVHRLLWTGDPSSTASISNLKQY